MFFDKVNHRPSFSENEVVPTDPVNNTWTKDLSKVKNNENINNATNMQQVRNKVTDGPQRKDLRQSVKKTATDSQKKTRTIQKLRQNQTSSKRKSESVLFSKPVPVIPESKVISPAVQAPANTFEILDADEGSEDEGSEDESDTVNTNLSQLTKCSNQHCLKPGEFQCSSCKAHKYCSKQCQQDDWPFHKLRCQSYRLERERAQEQAGRQSNIQLHAQKASKTMSRPLEQQPSSVRQPIKLRDSLQDELRKRPDTHRSPAWVSRMFSSHVVEVQEERRGQRQVRRIGLVCPNYSEVHRTDHLVPVMFISRYEYSEDYVLVHTNHLKRRFAIGDLVTVLTDRGSDRCGEVVGVAGDQTYLVRPHWGGGGDSFPVHVDRLLNVAPCLAADCLNGLRHRDGTRPRQGDDVIIFRDGRTGRIALVGNHEFYLISALDGYCFVSFPGDFKVLELEKETAAGAGAVNQKDKIRQPKKTILVEPVLPVSDTSKSCKLSRGLIDNLLKEKNNENITNATNLQHVKTRVVSVGSSQGLNQSVKQTVTDSQETSSIIEKSSRQNQCDSSKRKSESVLFSKPVPVIPESKVISPAVQAPANTFEILDADEGSEDEGSEDESNTVNTNLSQLTKCSNQHCLKPGEFQCSSCKAHKYCSKQCQQDDWPFHKRRCQSYRLERERAQEQAGRQSNIQLHAQKASKTMSRPLEQQPSSVRQPIKLRDSLQDELRKRPDTHRSPAWVSRMFSSHVVEVQEERRGQRQVRRIGLVSPKLSQTQCTDNLVPVMFISRRYEYSEDYVLVHTNHLKRRFAIGDLVTVLTDRGSDRCGEVVGVAGDQTYLVRPHWGGGGDSFPVHVDRLLNVAPCLAADCLNGLRHRDGTRPRQGDDVINFRDGRTGRIALVGNHEFYLIMQPDGGCFVSFPGDFEVLELEKETGAGAEKEEKKGLQPKKSVPKVVEPELPSPDTAHSSDPPALSKKAKRRRNKKERSAVSGDKSSEPTDVTGEDAGGSCVAVSEEDSAQSAKGDAKPVAKGDAAPVAKGDTEPVAKSEGELRFLVEDLLLSKESIESTCEPPTVHTQREGKPFRSPTKSAASKDNAPRPSPVSSAATDALYEVVRGDVSSAVKLELVTKLFESNLRAYIDINALHGAGANTALHVAARSGDLRLATYLLEQGASPLLPNGVGVLPEGKSGGMVALLRSARKTAKDAAKRAEKTRKTQLQETTVEPVPVEVAAPPVAAGESIGGGGDERLGRDLEDLRQKSEARSLQQLVRRAVESLARQTVAQAPPAPAPAPPVTDSAPAPPATDSGRAADRQKEWAHPLVSDPAEEDLEVHDHVDTAADEGVVETEMGSTMETRMGSTMELLLDSSGASLAEDSVWELEMTKEARHQWLQLRAPLRQMVADKLNELAQGRWSNLVRPTSHVTDLRLFRTNFSKGGRVIWERAIAYSSKLCCYCEVIRIWAIVVDHEKQSSCIRNIEESHRKGRTSKTLKQMRPVVKQGGLLSASDRQGTRLTLPRCFEEESGDTASLTLVTGDDAPRLWYPPAVPSPDSYVLLKFYQCTRGLLRRYCAELDEDASLVDFPFRLSPTEHAVCDLHPTPSSSVLLLGRSGTGKTTCLGFRMWFHYKAWFERFQSSRLLSECTQNLNQVFLTANPVLRSEVRKFFHSLLRGETGGVGVGSGTSQSPTEGKLSCGLDSPTLSQLPSSRFPLFLTKREWLVLLDGTLKRPFFPRLPGPGAELTAHSASYAWGRADHSGLSGLSDCFYDEDSDDEDYADSSGPGDEGGSVFGSVDGDASSGGGSRAARPARRVEIDYEYFERELWRIIPGAREYSASLLWCEFTSFIKGSAESLDGGSGCLTEAQYSEIGKKRAPNFTGSRPLVYSLFLEYEKLRKRIGGFDICDIVSHIYQELRWQAGRDREVASVDSGSGGGSSSNGYHGTPLHEVFVDEVQDFLGSEIMLMLAVADPNNLFLTGDDAQTIARGLSFRFSDIRSLFWKQNQCNSSIGVPPIFKLTNNYRTHSGILNLANSVIDLIWHFFPGTVDRLPHDRGLFDGPKPWLLHAASFDDLCLLLLGSDRDSQIEFGANQCVIVRDTASKAIIPEEIRRGGIVCSVFESKGLEFNDVLLYNFFTDSPAKNMWRCVLGAADVLRREDEDREDSLLGLAAVSLSSSQPATLSGAMESAASVDASSHKTKARPLEFDERQHKILLDELRHLYTAITRARVNIWIYDESEELREPMFEFFRRNDLVRVVRSVIELDELKITKGALTSQEEWVTQGRNLAGKGAYHLAHICFAKGREDLLATRALAQALARGQTTALDGTAATVLESSRPAGQRGKQPPTPAAESPQSLTATQRFRRAGELFLLSRPADCVTHDGLAEAASCFRRGGEVELAVQLYKAMGNFKLAAKCLDSAGLFFQAGVSYVELGKTAAAFRCFSKCSESKAEYVEGASLLARSNCIEDAVKLLLTCRAFSEAIDMVQRYSSSSKTKSLSTPEDIAILALKDAVVRNKGDAECLSWMQRVPRSSHPRVEQTLRDLRSTAALSLFLVRCLGKFVEGVALLAEKKQFLRAAELLAQAQVDCEEAADKKSLLRLQARCFAAAKRPVLAENAYSAAADTENAALIRVENLSASFHHTASTAATSESTRQAEITSQIITDLRRFLQLKHGWGVFWTLYNVFQTESIEDVFPSNKPTKVELVLSALKLINGFIKQIGSTHRKATKDFFELEDSTFKPGYVRYDKLATRLQTFLQGRLADETESPLSPFYLCQKSADIFALLTHRVIKHAFEDWKLKDYLVRSAGSHGVSQDGGETRPNSGLLPEILKTRNELIGILKDFGYIVRDAEKSSKSSKSSTSVLPEEWRELDDATSSCFRAYRKLVQGDLVRSLADSLRSRVSPTERGGGLIVPLREGSLKLPATSVFLLQEYLNAVLFGENCFQLTGSQLRSQPTTLASALLLITFADIASANDNVSWVQAASSRPQSMGETAPTNTKPTARLASTPVVEWFRKFLTIGGFSSKKQQCYLLRRSEAMCEFIGFMCEAAASPLANPRGADGHVAPENLLGSYSLKEPLVIPLLEELVTSALFHVAVPLTQHVLVPFSTAFGLLGSCSSWKSAHIRLHDQTMTTLRTHQGWSDSPAATTSHSYLSRLLRSCQRRLPEDQVYFQRAKQLLCDKIVPLLCSSLIAVTQDIGLLEAQTKSSADPSSPASLEVSKRLNNALYICSELQSLFVTVHVNVVFLNRLPHRDAALFDDIVSLWASASETVQNTASETDIDLLSGLSGLQKILGEEDADRLFEQSGLLCLDLFRNNLIPASAVPGHVRELLRLREQVGAAQAEREAQDLKAREEDQRLRNQAAVDAQRVARGFLARRKYSELKSASIMSNMPTNVEMTNFNQWFHIFFSLFMSTIGFAVYDTQYVNHPGIIFFHANFLENWGFSSYDPQWFVSEVILWLQGLAQAASRLHALRENITKYLIVLDSLLVKATSESTRSQLLSAHQGLLNDLSLVGNLLGTVQALVAQPGVGFSFIRSDVWHRCPEFYDENWEQKITTKLYKTISVCKATVKASESLAAQSPSEESNGEVTAAAGDVDAMSSAEQQQEQQQADEEVDDDDCKFEEEFTLVVGRKSGRASKRGAQKPIAAMSTASNNSKRSHPAGHQTRGGRGAGRSDAVEGAGNRGKAGKNFQKEPPNK